MGFSVLIKLIDMQNDKNFYSSVRLLRIVLNEAIIFLIYFPKKPRSRLREKVNLDVVTKIPPSLPEKRKGEIF
jgi:hypothetical protein